MVIEQVLDTRPTPIRVPTSFLIQLASLALTCNYFQFQTQFFQQIKGTAMGATMAPSLACLYVAAFEEHHIYKSEWWPLIFKWWRYIDDVLLIWIGTDAQFFGFLDWLNQCNPNLQFNHYIHHSQVDFLDITVMYQNQKFTTSLFRKSTDRNTLLAFDSFHPHHLKTNIPTGQFLRLRRLCSSTTEYITQAQNMIVRFQERGYPYKILKRAYKRALYVRDFLFLKSTHQQDPTVNCILPFSTSSKTISALIRKHWAALALDKFFRSLRFMYRRGRNLRDILVHTVGHPADMTYEGGHRPCGRCSVCQHTNTLTQFAHPHSGCLYKLSGTSDCNTRGVVYVITCPCQLLYVGKTQRSIKTCIIEHRSSINISKENAPLVSHWIEKSHTTADLQFFVLEVVLPPARGGDYSLILLRHEQRWIFRLNTIIPHGLNSEIEWNHFL
ncbi:corrinoid adenosyltransferase isoform X1 [Rhinatrema bivittatum]|uniref:corrinoid adenosyltransferase isoform X1 n=1 Tax=Rhinatrema bivittatum TaxID=194408 RepID=UPI001127CF52|nr:corrinoid adenosyltransferase isoform X1 [Rhinatrema bivittatum]